MARWRTWLATVCMVCALRGVNQGLAQAEPAVDGIHTTRDTAAGVGPLSAGPPLEAGVLDPVGTADDTADDTAATAPLWRQVLWQSLCGPLQPELWRPLDCGSLLEEGWDEPYLPAPHDTPHQTWVNSLDGGFYRQWMVSFSYPSGMPGPAGSNAFNSGLYLFSPFSRRLEIGWFLPLDASISSTTNAVPQVGDLTVAPRVLLTEQKNFTSTANLFIRTPTGSVSQGNGVASVSPDIEAWWTGPQHWIVRGAVGVTLPVNYSGEKAQSLAAMPWTGINASPGAFKAFDARLAIGKQLGAGDDPYQSQLVAYLAANLHAGLGSGSSTYFTLTPGLRYHLGENWSLLGGLEVPLVRPYPFTLQPIVQLVRNF